MPTLQKSEKQRKLEEEAELRKEEERFQLLQANTAILMEREASRKLRSSTAQEHEYSRSSRQRAEAPDMQHEASIYSRNLI